MKIAVVTALALSGFAATAAAQDSRESQDGSRPRRSIGYSTSVTGGYAYPGYGTWGGGYGSGYATGTGYGWSPASGWGYGGGCRPGFITGYPGFGAVWAGYRSGWGGYYGGYGYYGRDPWFGMPSAEATVAGPATAPAVDRSPGVAAVREMQEGRRRFHAGDYRGALDSFRSGVVATPDDAVAQAWFAVALMAAGDGRNADKALRAAAAAGLRPGSLSLDGVFRDDKERVRMIVAFAKQGGDGSLAASYALSLAGEPVRLRQLAEKDPVAKQLLPKP
ncbi:MAG TPA: hypothetical protein VE981_01255 [Planctomycetota bacterium]|nr:hypothetical protein [Planctomycetota bacterium]